MQSLLGNLAAKIIPPPGRSLRVFVLGAQTPAELAFLLSGVCARVPITAWSEPALETADAALAGLQRVSFSPDPREWDLVVVAPRALEVCGERGLRQLALRSLGLLSRAEGAKAVVPCVFDKASSPSAIRGKVFEHLPANEHVLPAFGEDEAYAALEGLGIVDIESARVDLSVNLESFFLGNDVEAQRQVSEWLRVALEMCRRALPGEMAALRKLCEPNTCTIRQSKIVLSFPAAPGFNHDDLAQPSVQAWWPAGDRNCFQNHGLQTWNEQRERWVTQRAAAAAAPRTPLPKMSTRQLNDLVELLATTYDRVDLPGPMRLDDLLDVLVDVWESVDDS